MHISAKFDGGNIKVIDAGDERNISLEIVKDHQSNFYQWFYFKLANARPTKHVLNIVNARDSAYADGWPGYRAVASYDRVSWFRVPTEYDGERLIISFTPEYDSVYFAYFAPYSYERHQDLLHRAQLEANCQLQVLGETLDGREISLLKIGQEGEGKRVVWLTARQHLGETMAEWFMEGFIDRLIDKAEGVARSLLDRAVFYLVPNMNPDGSVRGHLRTNAAGVNLNREWADPSMEKSPEVYLVRKKMLEVGVDLHLDIHGDDSIPVNFFDGCEGIPSYDQRHKTLEDNFKALLLAITPEFQDQRGYDKDAPPRSANLAIATNWVGERFKCLALTKEMPFKGHDELPDDRMGWSDQRSRILGRDFLTGICHVVGELR